MIEIRLAYSNEKEENPQNGVSRWRKIHVLRSLPHGCLLAVYTLGTYKVIPGHVANCCIHTHVNFVVQPNSKESMALDLIPPSVTLSFPGISWVPGKEATLFNLKLLVRIPQSTKFGDLSSAHSAIFSGPLPYVNKASMHKLHSLDYTIPPRSGTISPNAQLSAETILIYLTEQLYSFLNEKV